jgi:hypothetical protein
MEGDEYQNNTGNTTAEFKTEAVKMDHDSKFTGNTDKQPRWAKTSNEKSGGRALHRITQSVAPGE